MSLPSFAKSFYQKSISDRPRIQVLLVRKRDDPTGEVKQILMVEREESYTVDPASNKVLEASIKLTYWAPALRSSWAPIKGSFGGSYHGYINQVCLTSSSSLGGGGAVFLDPGSLRGCRVGTYLMNAIVEWAKQWPEAQVRTIELLVHQADAENKERRNAFYENFGIEFNYSDDKKAEGRSRQMLAGALKLSNSWQKNITEQSFEEFLPRLYEENRKALSDAESFQRSTAWYKEELKKAEKRPVRWAIKVMYRKYLDGGVLFALLLAVGLCLLAWKKCDG
jgi:GNAT superfamily N-acetyltransferase